MILFLFNYCNINCSAAFCNGIVEALEADEWTWIVNSSSLIFNLTLLSFDVYKVFVCTNLIGLSCSKPFQESFWLKTSHEFFWSNLGWVLSEDISEVLFDFSRLNVIFNLSNALSYLNYKILTLLKSKLSKLKLLLFHLHLFLFFKKFFLCFFLVLPFFVELVSRNCQYDN